jgi:hypothetical protein
MTRLHIAFLILAPALAATALAGTARIDGVQAGAVPRVVAAAEGLAEDIQADLDTLGWQAARAKLAELQLNRTLLRAAVPALKAVRYETALDSLTAQIARHDRAAALSSANQLSRVLLTITADYDLIVPVQVGYLDVAGRDAIYGAATRRWQDAAGAAAELRANYAIVRAHVAAKDRTLDQRVQRRLSELDGAVAAKNTVRVKAIATTLLDDVDLVEQTY